MGFSGKGAKCSFMTKTHKKKNCLVSCFRGFHCIILGIAEHGCVTKYQWSRPYTSSTPCLLGWKNFGPSVPQQCGGERWPEDKCRWHPSAVEPRRDRRAEVHPVLPSYPSARLLPHGHLPARAVPAAELLCC